MTRRRDEFYGPGLPARPGQHYRAFTRFARKYAGRMLLDVGCGYGAYSLALSGDGTFCVGCDVNVDYLHAAIREGLPVVAVDETLPFADGAFDTVILFEVIEHVPQMERLLSEAFRVARSNVLITVPNSEDMELMKANDVTYAHMLSSDHVNFFEVDSLRALLSRYSGDVSVERSDPLYPYWFLSRSVAYYALRVLFRAGLLKPRIYTRLYAVARVRQN